MSRNPLQRSWLGLLWGLRFFCGTLFAVLVLTVLWGVFSRYVLGTQGRWTEEAAIYLFIWVSLLGAPLAYREGAHLGVDYLVSKFDSAARRIAAMAVEVIVLSASLFAFVYGGLRLAAETLNSGQVTPVLGWPTGYLYLAAPLAGLFFIGCCVEKLVRLGSTTTVGEETS